LHDGDDATAPHKLGQKRDSLDPERLWDSLRCGLQVPAFLDHNPGRGSARDGRIQRVQKILGTGPYLSVFLVR